MWDRNTGQPVYNALVWQDTRQQDIVDMVADGNQDRFREKTGLPLATYFSGTKIRWILDNVEGARARAEAGDLMFGNIDTWVHLEPHGRDRRRRARHRRHERQPHDADEPRDPRLGRRAAEHRWRTALDAADDQGLVRGLRRREGRAPRGHPGRGRPRRPAGRDVRAGRLRHRRREEHLRHGQLHAAQHRHRDGAVEERSAHDRRLEARRPARRSTASRARSRSPARWCSGSATTWA